MLIPSRDGVSVRAETSLSRRVNANSQPLWPDSKEANKLIKKGEC